MRQEAAEAQQYVLDMRIELRDEEWRMDTADSSPYGSRRLTCTGQSELVRGGHVADRVIYSAAEGQVMSDVDKPCIVHCADDITMLHERTVISKQPEQVAREKIVSPRSERQVTLDLVFRDPSIIEFQGHKDGYLENASLRELETFLLELGNSFPSATKKFCLPPIATYPKLI